MRLSKLTSDALTCLIPRACSTLASAARWSNDPLQVQQLSLRALTLFKPLHQPWAIAWCLQNLGIAAALSDDRPGGLRYYAQADSVYRQLRPRDLQGEINLLTATITIYNILNRYDKATPAARQALALVRGHEANFQEEYIMALRNMAPVYNRAHQQDSMVLVMKHALQLALQSHSVHAEMDLLTMLGQQRYCAGDPRGAEQYAVQAVHRGWASGQKAELRDALLLLAQYMRVLHRPAAFDSLESYLWAAGCSGSTGSVRPPPAWRPPPTCTTTWATCLPSSACKAACCAKTPCCPPPCWPASIPSPAPPAAPPSK